MKQKLLAITLTFTDADPETCQIYEHGALYCIKPIFHIAKEITREQFIQIESMVTADGTSPNYFYGDTNMTYNDFFDKYYNNQTIN